VAKTDAILKKTTFPMLQLRFGFHGIFRRHPRGSCQEHVFDLSASQESSSRISRDSDSDYRFRRSAALFRPATSNSHPRRIKS
jgi:hypothetical protein